MRALVGATGAAFAAGLLGVAGHPEAWSAGVAFVGRTVLAVAGTSAVAAVLGACLVAGFLLRGDLVRSGALDGLAALGWGAADVGRWSAPLLVAAAALALVGGFAIEPAAWTAMHGLKGSPALSAASLARLERGDVVALPDGAVVAVDGALAVRLGTIEATIGGLAPAEGGWTLNDVRVEGAESRWSAASVMLRPVALPGPPASPWTRGWSALRAQAHSGGGAGARAARVWHRRHALVVLAPLLGLLGFLVGPMQRRAPGGGARIGALALGLFLVLRAADRMGQADLLGPALAGWAPVLACAVLALVLRR